jgi:hypothetical protein
MNEASGPFDILIKSKLNRVMGKSAPEIAQEFHLRLFVPRG